MDRGLWVVGWLVLGLQPRRGGMLVARGGTPGNKPQPSSFVTSSLFTSSLFSHLVMNYFHVTRQDWLSGEEYDDVQNSMIRLKHV